MKLVIKILAVLCVIMGGKLCMADSWAPPFTLIYLSENKSYFAYIEPVSETINRKIPLLKVFKINDVNFGFEASDFNNVDEKARFKLWQDKIKKWEGNKQITFLWEQNLSNFLSPVAAFISNDGKYVVTMDNWAGIGQGDDVVAFYKKEGQIKKYSLIDVLPVKVENTLDWDHLFPVSTMSIHWHDDSIIFLGQVDNRLLFCIWLEWNSNWLAFDVSNGTKVNIDVKLRNQINQVARKIALETIKNEGGTYSNFSASCLLLGRMRVPEDRKILESVLSDKDFGSGALESGGRRPYSESYYRKAADTALSIWDKKLPDETNYRWSGDITYNYLGTFSGKIILPEQPKEKSVLWIYLIPESVPVNKWSMNDIVQPLSSPFDDYFFFKWKLPESTIFDFKGVTPGKYWLKAVYEVESSGDYWIEDKKHKPKKGDYENTKSPVFEVKAGQTVDVGSIDCNSPVKE